MKDFYQGTLYDQEWIEQAIRSNGGLKTQLGGTRVLSIKDDYQFMKFEDSEKCKKLNIGRKKRFTICEGIMMFQIISTNKTDNMNSINFWKRVEAKQQLPERTADQLKKFYTKYGELTPEQWLVQAIHGQTDFSFSVPSIPNEDFLPNFKQKYEFEFIRLDATTGQMSGLKDHSSFGKAANLNSHHVSATNTAQIEEKQVEGPVMSETHVNLVDNSIVPKLEQVSYSLDEPLDCLNLATRP